ncbi:MAG: hypothetical protein LH629_05170 [Ignavibacteria bacterium]|nr:hypothetical protein [Ignavibacteria bacterium]
MYRNDTHPNIEKKLFELYASLTHEERFNKMLSMCQTAREIVLSQLPAHLSESEKKKELFKIYYQQDFSKEEFEKILKSLFG